MNRNAPLERSLPGQRFTPLGGQPLPNQPIVAERERNRQVDHVRLDRTRQDAVGCKRRPRVEPGSGDNHDSQQPAITLRTSFICVFPPRKGSQILLTCGTGDRLSSGLPDP